MRISPSPAACSNRAAVLTASPVTSVSPVPAPVTTSPVLMPMRIDNRAGAQAGVRSLDRVEELRGRADGPQRIVLVGGRHAEDGHHRVPDELLNSSAVELEDRAGIGEVSGEE